MTRRRRRLRDSRDVVSQRKAKPFPFRPRPRAIAIMWSKTRAEGFVYLATVLDGSAGNLVVGWADEASGRPLSWCSRRTQHGAATRGRRWARASCRPRQAYTAGGPLSAVELRRPTGWLRCHVRSAGAMSGACSLRTPRTADLPARLCDAVAAVHLRPPRRGGRRADAGRHRLEA